MLADPLLGLGLGAVVDGDVVTTLVPEVRGHAVLDRGVEGRHGIAVEVGRQFALGHTALQALAQGGKILGAAAAQIRADGTAA